jgi:hypothetical protein
MEDRHAIFYPPSSILHLLSSIFYPSGAFRDSPATKNYGAFQDIAHARTGETSYFQRHHFGALFALHVERTM